MRSLFPRDRSAPEAAAAARAAAGDEFDAVSLPAGFWDRGFSDADFEWWRRAFREAVNQRDSHFANVLFKGEVRRLGRAMEGLRAELSGEPYEVGHRLPEINADIARLGDYVRRVQHTAAPFQSPR